MNTIDTKTTRVVRLAAIAIVGAVALSIAAIAWMGDYIMQVNEALGSG